MSREIAGWAIHRDENGGICAMRESDTMRLWVPSGDFYDPVGQTLRLLLVDLFNEAAPKPATVAVDAGALDELREAMAKLRKLPESAVSRPAGAVARERVMEAARRLLAGGGQ